MALLKNARERLPTRLPDVRRVQNEIISQCSITQNNFKLLLYLMFIMSGKI